MSEIISKWIRHRLGLVIDMSADNFAIKTANGNLLAQILCSYQIIVPQQLDLILETDHINKCYENYKHINLWLKDLNITIPDEDLYEIVHGIGTASLHLFYQVFLELKDKTQLDFLTENEIAAQLGQKFTRFRVTKVDSVDDPNKINLHREGLCEPLLAGGDVYHWYRDRMENLQNKCKEAREEYAYVLKTRCNSCNGMGRMPGIRESGFVLARSLVSTPKPSVSNDDPFNILPNEIISDDKNTYEELVKKQKEAQTLQPLIPNSQEAKKIMKKLKVKSKIRHENRILKNELHLEIMNKFDEKINKGKQASEDRVLTKIFLKQTCFEKELVSKLGQVKMHKEFMIENKFKQGEILNNLKEKEFVESLLLQDKELNEKKLIYYLERERILNLHRKLYAEKLKFKAQEAETICSNAVKDMVDVSIRISEYKKMFGHEPSRREFEELKNIFVSGEPVFNICEPVINIIKEVDEDIPEEIITQETLRQNAIDDEEFNNYMHYGWPWELTNVECTQEQLEQITCGLNILGHLVHQALLAKYPLPKLKEVPHFPDADIRVCINGLNDSSCVPILKNLLFEKGIYVIDLSEAVNFCLEAFQKESKREYDEEEIASKDVKKKKEKAKKKPKKGAKSSSKSKGAKSDDTESAPAEIPKVLETKIVQTPIIFPCEEIAYSPQALLGQTVQSMLDEGKYLSDFDLMAIFVEYLKSLSNLKGWVLLNYPTNYEQAAILEEVFTGKKIFNKENTLPHSNSALEIPSSDVRNKQVECNSDHDLSEKRKSLLLPNPVVPETSVVYDTILTAYIKIKKLLPDERSGDYQLPPIFEELESEPDPLDKFYSDTGANYSMYYKDFDLATIKYLGKLIIGDFSLPLKSSVELFGESVNYVNLEGVLTKPIKSSKKGEKLKKPKERITKSQAATTAAGSEKKTATEEKKSKKGKGKAKAVIVHEDKWTQIPTEDEDKDSNDDISRRDDSIRSIKPGQEGWEYSTLPCPDELLRTLATIWETVEEIYINDLKQILFLKRLKMNCVVPYAQFVKDLMKKHINRPDYKGFYLAKFQNAFNAFDLDFRKDDEFKAEMYCRIEDFKEKLAEMCDQKMMSSEDTRCGIIGRNWVPLQITELLNDYINMFQIEMDRFTDSVRFINDFYMGIFTGMPCEEDFYKEDNFPKIINISPDEVNFMLQNVDSTVDLSFFQNLLSDLIQKATGYFKKLNAIASNQMEKVKSIQTASNKPKSKASSPKSKSSKGNKKPDDLVADILKENCGKLVEEWQYAMKGETLRVSLRFELIKFNALQALEEFLKTMRNSLHDIYEEMRSKYWKEIENIQKACNIIHAAVENENPLQKEFIFVDDTFYINPEINLFDNAPIISEKTEDSSEEAFTVRQLSKIVDILLALCPSGYILRSSFNFILQDIIWNSPEDGSESMAPNIWKKLDSPGLKAVLDELFDDLEYVYWRDFIIYNLGISYPTEKELLLTRKKLRECDPDATELVTDYHFYGTKLWFDCAYKEGDANKLREAKELLCKLYYVKNYGVNYTALLLDFCKDEHLLEGFGKALELSLGKMVCWDPDIGNTFTQEFIRKMNEHNKSVRLREEEQAEYYKVAYEEVCKLVDYVVHISEDIIIEDYIEKKVSDKDSEKEKPRRGSILKKSTDLPSSKRSSKGEEVKMKDIRENTGKSPNEKSKQSLNSEETNSQETSSLRKESFKVENLENESLIVKLCNDLPNKVDTDASDYTQIALFLPLDVVITVITAALPWHSRVAVYEDLSFWEQAVQIYEKNRNPSFNMSVLTHEFLNSDDFLQLLGMTKKFKALDPIRIVRNLVKDK